MVIVSEQQTLQIPRPQTSFPEPSRILVFDPDLGRGTDAGRTLEKDGQIECCATLEEARDRSAIEGLRGAVINVSHPEGLTLLEEIAPKVPTVILTEGPPCAKLLRKAIESRARAVCTREEINDLPLYLRVAQSTDDIDTLWAIWLWRPVKYVNIEFPFGEDVEAGEDGAFFREIRSRQPQPQYSIELRGETLLVTHCDGPLNHYAPSSILSFYRILRHVERRSNIQVILYRSGLSQDFPPTAVSRTARKLPWGLGKTMLGGPLARGLLRMRYPGIHRTRTLGAGMPLETLNNEAMLAVTEHFGIATFMKLFTYPKPVVILLEGLAVAGCFELALCAHYILATPRAMVSLPECKLAFPPPAGIPLLAYRVGLQRAFSIAADTRLIGAQEACNLGVIDRVIRSRDAFAEGLKHARRLARSQAITGCDYLRDSFRETLHKELQEGFRAWKRVSQTPEARKRIRAFQAHGRR